MRAGELAAKIREATEIPDLVALGSAEHHYRVRSLVWSHLPLILAALDVAEAEQTLETIALEASDAEILAACDVRDSAYEALRRAEEG